MSAAATPLIDFVRDMDRLGVPPFRHDNALPPRGGRWYYAFTDASAGRH